MKKFTKAILLAALCLASLPGCKDSGEDGSFGAYRAKLTGEPCQPAALGIRGDAFAGGTYPIGISTADGLYYLDRYAPSRALYNTPHDTIMFRENEHGRTMPLCPRPNCLHDGSLYCTANTEHYRHGALACADGFFYAVGETADPLAGAYEKKGVLLRYAMDGSEITELCDLGSNVLQDMPLGAAPLVHRGYLWLLVGDTKMHEVSGGSVTLNTGWRILAYELETGRLSELLAVLPEDRSAEVTLAHPTALWADGDFLYYSVEENGERAENAHPGTTYRIDLTNGKCSEYAGSAYCYIGDGKAVEAFDGELSLCDLATKEGVKMQSDTPLSAGLYDGQYVYAGTEKDGKAAVLVFAPDGKQLQEYTFPDVQYAGDLAVMDGKLYVHFFHTDEEFKRLRKSNMNAESVCVRVCDVSAAADGSAQWETSYLAWQPVDETAVQDTMQLGLTDDMDDSLTHGLLSYDRIDEALVCESPDSWYYTTHEGKRPQLWRVSKATGEAALVELDTAYDFDFYGTIWQDGYLYAQAVRYEETAKNRYQLDCVLLRISADGSEVKQLSHMGSCDPLAARHLPVIHRGYGWCIVDLNVDQSRGIKGYAVYGCSLTSGAATQLMGQQPYRDDQRYYTPPMLWALGDDLLMGFPENEWGNVSGDKPLRVSLRSGYRENLSVRELIYACGNYLVDKSYQNGDWRNPEYSLCFAVTDERVNLGVCAENNGAGICTVFGDAERLYILWAENGQSILRVHDLTGKVLDEIPLENGMYFSNMAISGGRLYACHGADLTGGSGKELTAPTDTPEVLYADLSDLHSGWKLAYKIQSQIEN